MGKRSWSCILLIAILLGDPGLGKSQILQAAAAVSPRGIYVCGNATTKAGLTVAVVKDSMTSDYAFEAGSYFIFPFLNCDHLAILFVYSAALECECFTNDSGGGWLTEFHKYFNFQQIFEIFCVVYIYLQCFNILKGDLPHA